MAYFLYKSQNVANIGGVFPKTLDDEFELGLGVYDEYYLGKVTSVELVSKIREYFVYFLTDEEAAGFKLLGVTEIPLDPFDMESETRALTEEELANQKAANKILLKLKLRTKIHNDIGDMEDLISDMSKRVDLLERLVMRIFYFTLQNQTIPQEILDAYLPLITSYIGAVDNQLLITRADLEDPGELFGRLSQRFTSISKLVKEEYLDKIDA